MQNNISLEEAQSMLLDYIGYLKEEVLPLNNSIGKVLSKDIQAQENIPPFNRSPYDGYAFRSKDTEKASAQQPVILKVIEHVAAGYVAQKEVSPGTAIKVMTGAPMPVGADVVIKYEDVMREGDYIKIFTKQESGSNIILAGEDLKRGDLIASDKTVLTPALIGLLASVGVSDVPVYQKPKIAIISTGDELVDVKESLRPGKIRNSNSYVLEAACQELGVEPLVMGNVVDKKEEVAAQITKGLEKADMVITTGGVSVGDYDVVKDALLSIGAEVLFWKINIKPGQPTLAAIKGNKVILGLSGNPASALTVFQLLGIPLLKKLSGRANYLPERIKAVLANGFKKASPKRRFLRGKLVIKEGTAQVELTEIQGNAILRSMVGCNSLVDIASGSGPLKAGDEVTAHIVI